MGRLIDAEILERKLKAWNFGKEPPYWIQKCIDETPTVEITQISKHKSKFDFEEEYEEI